MLLRDYLAASRLRAVLRTNEAEVRDILNRKFEDTFWRESLILLIALESSSGCGERLLCQIRDDEGGFSRNLTLFIKDCICRGGVFSANFCEGLFQAFEDHAVEEQHEFGACKNVLSGGYGMFWQLLQLQRIPAARSAVLRAVSRAKPNTIMSEWPDSDRAKTFTPRHLYAGKLATSPAIL